jgi:hypothetical protein
MTATSYAQIAKGVINQLRIHELVRLLVVELTHSDSNPKFIANYSFSGRRYSHRQ